MKTVLITGSAGNIGSETLLSMMYHSLANGKLGMPYQSFINLQHPIHFK